MDSRMSDVDFEGLDRLLGALAESVASRVDLDEHALSVSSSSAEALPAEWRDVAAAVQVDSLPRGVPLRTVVRGALGRFFPAAVTVVAPLALLVFLANPVDYAVNLQVLGPLVLTTLGFALGLGALSPWLYPHSNPDGRRSEVAGFVSPLPWLLVMIGLSNRWIPHVPGIEWVVPMATGISLAVIANAPWLRRTSRIAPASPHGRWAKLRAIGFSGGVGASLFGAAHLVWFLPPGLAAGRMEWDVVFIILSIASSFGFLAGVSFAIALAVVYRRHALEELRAWKAGLWGALAAAIPPLVIHFSRAPGAIFDPLAYFLTALIIWNLPGFLMGYAMVKLAQASRSKA